METSDTQIAAFYRFAPIQPEEVAGLAAKIRSLGESQHLKGLIILAAEGINGTISASTRDAAAGFLVNLEALLGTGRIEPKWSNAQSKPFRKFKVRIRNEIVTLGQPEIQALPAKSNRHLQPAEWQRVLEEEDVILLDTRNWYETEIGIFRGAIDPRLDEFQEFRGYIDRAELPKEKKILIYCTGGIRCEKAIVEMENKGFRNVFQLDGGILNYLTHYPNKNFSGECFVFDQRVALDQDLKPTEHYKMCPHCGQPADRKIICLRCDGRAVLCLTCVSGGKTGAETHLQTCSKNCAHHFKTTPGKKGRSQNQGYRFHSSVTSVIQIPDPESVP